MTVELIAHTPCPVTICGEAAALCTKTTFTRSALKSALASGHESILEHASFSFRVQGVSRALLAQLTRHRIASFSVQSQRYVDMGSMPGITPASIQADAELYKEYFFLARAIRDFYHKAVAKGIPKEDARYITPQAAFTELIVTMNARELRHFFTLRCCNRAQWEIRELADRMLAECKKAAPELFEDAGSPCMAGKPCPEGKRTCGKPRGKAV